jgi:hypothetical protein
MGRRWMGEGGGGMDSMRRKEEEEDTKLREEGWDGNGEAPCFVSSGGTCSC